MVCFFVPTIITCTVYTFDLITRVATTMVSAGAGTSGFEGLALEWHAAIRRFGVVEIFGRVSGWADRLVRSPHARGECALLVCGISGRCWGVGDPDHPVWMLVFLGGLGCFPSGPPSLFLVLVLCRARTPCPVFSNHSTGILL